MKITKTRLKKIINVVADRSSDYYENCIQYESDEEGCYPKGYGENLNLAVDILNALEKGELIKVINR
jgi:hypothetical protein